MQGVIVTTYDFTSSAKEAAKKTQPLVTLLTCDMLIEQLLEHNIEI